MSRVVVFAIGACIATGAAMAGGSSQPADPYANRGDFREAGPITDAERNAPWPSRDRAAPEYRDAFCKTWDDACTRCRRDALSRSVQCRPVNDGAACERKTIVCTEKISTQARVCLSFSDGCNTTSNGNGASTAVLCRSMAPRGWDSTCVVPRGSARPKSDDGTAADLAGHWWLVGPAGDACIVTFNTIAGMGVSDPCSPSLKSRFSAYLSAFETWPRPACRYEARGDRLTVRCPTLPGSRAKPFDMAFSIRNIENPVGIGRSAGWRLLRISTLW